MDEAAALLFRWWLDTSDLSACAWAELVPARTGAEVRYEAGRVAAHPDPLVAALELHMQGYEPLLDLLVDGDLDAGVKPPRDAVAYEARRITEAWIRGDGYDEHALTPALFDVLAGDPGWLFTRLRPEERMPPELVDTAPTQRTPLLASLLWTPWRESRSRLFRCPLCLVLEPRAPSPTHGAEDAAAKTAAARETIEQVLRGPLPELDHWLIADDILMFAVLHVAANDPDWLRAQLRSHAFPRPHRTFVARQMGPRP